MILILRALGRMFKWLAVNRTYIPGVILGSFLVLQFAINWIMVNLPFAFEQLAKTIFAAELIINQNVHLAILNAPEYGLWKFLEILLALYMIFLLVKFLTMIQLKLAGATSEWGAYMISIMIVGIMEISAIKMVDGSFGFIPIWNGIIFLFINIVPVFTHIFGPAVAYQTAENVTTVIVNNTSI